MRDPDPDAEEEPHYPDPRKEDIYVGDRRISRPDSAFPDWYIPDAKYRPIPIAWFAAAFLIQMGVLFAIFVVLSEQSGWLTIGLCSLATGAIGKWAWDRGMAKASSAWRVATIAMLSVQLALVCLGAGARL